MHECELAECHSPNRQSRYTLRFRSFTRYFGDDTVVFSLGHAMIINRELATFSTPPVWQAKRLLTLFGYHLLHPQPRRRQIAGAPVTVVKKTAVEEEDPFSPDLPPFIHYSRNLTGRR